MTESTKASDFNWPEEDPREQAREAALPEHERDTDTSVGAGVIAAAGASTDTGSADATNAETKRDDPPGDGGDPDVGLMNEEDQPVLDEPGRLQMGGRSG